ncbi:hypothetical protein SBA3_940019 [Candidatus Sulfopaludibacter sp. SbA3]|nr:hypothetical protein SBA3_940019 [Candidatus Sulfopaludibacter sp. SbA3]
MLDKKIQPVLCGLKTRVERFPSHLRLYILRSRSRRKQRLSLGVSRVIVFLRASSASPRLCGEFCLWPVNGHISWQDFSRTVAPSPGLPFALTAVFCQPAKGVRTRLTASPPKTASFG